MGKSRLRTGVAYGLLAGGLGGCSGGGGGGGFGRITVADGWECTIADTWQVRGFDYSHFASAQPGELLAATLRRGDLVALDLTNSLPSTCSQSIVASVQWNSTSPDVGAVAARGARGADLRAVAPGETRVSAEVVLSDGSRQTAELYAVPSPGSPVLRVYAVRVIP